MARMTDPFVQPAEPTAADAISEIGEELELFDDWMERYEFIIGMGRKLPPFPDEWADDAHRVPGCQSKVWMEITRARRADLLRRRLGCGDRLGPGGAAFARLFGPNGGGDPGDRPGVPEGAGPAGGAVDQSRQRHRLDGAQRARGGVEPGGVTTANG